MGTPGDTARGALTYEDYCALPDDGRRYEILDGELGVTPAPAPRHQKVVLNLASALDKHVRAHDLGEVYVAPIDVILARTSVVQPDLVFVRAERLSLVTARAIEGPPDLVVEVLSPTTEARDRGVKRELYARFGVPHYWLLDSEARRLTAYALAGTTYRQVAERTGTAEFTPTLFPGLTLPLAAIWPR